MVNQGHIWEFAGIALLVFGVVYGLASGATNPDTVTTFIELMFFAFLFWGLGTRSANRIEDMKRTGTLPKRNPGSPNRDPRNPRDPRKGKPPP